MTVAPPGAGDVPDVSVLVLAYNHEKYIAECLDGILSQDFDGSVEVLVGEDWSTDATGHIVDDYAARYPETIRVLRGTANVGMHENHRRLLRAARGRYVAYCEGDDYWHRADKLTLQVALLDRRPEVIGVHSEVDHLEVVNGRLRRHHDYWRAAQRHIPSLLSYADLVGQNSVQTCSVMVRREALMTYPESRFARGMYPMEDWPLFLHVLESGPLAYLPRSLATYRRVAGSATRQDPESMARFYRGEWRLIVDAAQGHPECAPSAQDGLSRVRASMARLGLSSGDAGMIRDALAMGRASGVPETAGTRTLARLVTIPGADVALPFAARGVRSVNGLRRPPR